MANALIGSATNSEAYQTLLLDDPASHPLILPIPKFPKTLDVFSFEFWFKFTSDSANPSLYDIELIADAKDANRFKVTNKRGNNY
jgi:hypothetical protein